MEHWNLNIFSIFRKNFYLICRHYQSLLSKIVKYGQTTVLLVLLGACTTDSENYISFGIGAKIPSPNYKKVSNNQSDYFTALCLSAVNTGNSGNSGLCPPSAVDRELWTLIVQQGMNDIDRRCDGYLEWLDRKKRNKEPNLRLVNSTLQRTTAAIGLIWPSTTATANLGTSLAINLVTQFFGLLTDGVENYHSRLLMAAESSTVNSIVFRERDNYRRETIELVYISRPAAEYALRQYLRICLPFTIESQINGLATLGSRGITPRRDNSLLQNPASVPIRGIAATVPKGSVDPIIDQPDPIKIAPNALSDFEKTNITPKRASLIQRAICVPVTSNLGPAGSLTREAIKQFEIASNELSAGDPTKQVPVNGIIDTQSGYNDIVLSGRCNGKEYKTAYEKFRYPNSTKIIGLQTSIQRFIKKNIPASNTDALQSTGFRSGVLDQSTRSAIGAINNAIRETGKLAITPKFVRILQQGRIPAPI